MDWTIRALLDGLVFLFVQIQCWCRRFSPVNQAIESGSAAPLLGIRAEDGVSVCKREASNASLVACCSALRL